MDAGLTLVAAGLSHKTASLSMRERASLNAEELPGALNHMGSKVGNGVILSTCNRTEIYFVTEPGISGQEHALELFAGATGTIRPRIEQHTYYHRDEAAVRHLHRVASGMDSMIFGEVEILRQVRSAMTSSFETGYLTSILDRLFHSALRAGRRLHAETFLGKYDRSVASGAVTLARGVLGDLSQSKVLVLGAGDAGAMTIKAMLREGASGIRIANRTYSRAANLATHTGTEAVPLRRVPELLCEVDLVICASASSLLSIEALRSAILARRLGPIVLVDIGVPRNIDPSVRDIPGSPPVRHGQPHDDVPGGPGGTRVGYRQRGSDLRGRGRPIPLLVAVLSRSPDDRRGGGGRGGGTSARAGQDAAPGSVL